MERQKKGPLSREEKLAIAVEENIKDVITEQFYLQASHHIRLTAEVISNLVRQQFRFVTLLDIKKCLAAMGYAPGFPEYFRFRYGYNDEFLTKKGRCYTFNSSDFMSEDDLELFNDMLKQ